MEDCFKNNSALEEIYKIIDEGPEKVTNIPVEPKKNKLVNKNFKRNFFEIVGNLVESLREIHSKNYVHSGINPGDILISNDNNYKIADFGSVVKNNHSIRAYTEGYLNYVNNNKRMRNKEIIASPSMDYFALGKTLFEILTLEVNVNFSQTSSASVSKLISESLYNKGLDSFYADIINDILKNRFESIANYKKFIECKSIITSSQSIPNYSFESEQKNLNKCSKCRLLGYAKNDLINFACKHNFHKSCMYFYKGLYICDICSRFIGTNALKIYLNKL